MLNSVILIASYKKGNALPEYIMPLALITLVTVPMWINVSNGFGGQVANVFASKSSVNNSAGSVVNSGNASGGGGLSGSFGLGNNTGNTTSNTYPFDGSITGGPIAETAGANGDSQKVTAAAEALTALLNRRSTGGGMTQESDKLGSIISRMANKGHSISSSMQLGEIIDVNQRNSELVALFEEFKQFKTFYPALVDADADDIIQANFRIIDEEAKSSITYNNGNNAAVTKSANTICNQGGKNCIK